MARQSFSKFIRPEEVDRGQITDRDLDILHAVLRYRFCSAAQLVRIVGGNEDVTHRRLRRLWEWALVNRWAFPGIRSHSEFYYYLDNQAALNLLAEHRALDIHAHMLEDVRNNREKNYADAAFSGQHMQLGFLQHSLMVSRMHFLIELACRKSAGQAELVSWVQGAPLTRHKVEVKKVRASRSGNEYVWQETGEAERLPVEPDGLFSIRFNHQGAASQLAHFVYEADRGTMVMTDLLKKLRAYFHFIKKQQRHKEAFGIHPIRAVLIETTHEARARKIMKLVHHPLVCGPVKRAGLFWFTVSPLFTETMIQSASGRSVPRYLQQPEVVLDRIWALPDFSLHALADLENSGER